VLDWHASGNMFGAAHTVDLPLLLGSKKTWDGVGLIAGADWESVEMTGRKMRALWAGFARGDDLGKSGGIPGVLRYRGV
ncbi:MAG: carboxylesterase/lipase family protein, partial [Actinomycetes bacterium]